MEFRWVAIISLWTLISGPILGVPTAPVTAGKSGKAAVVKVVKTRPALPVRR